MRKRTGYLIQGALPTIAALGLLLLASSGPAFAGFKEHNFHGRYVASYHAFDSSITGTVNEPNPPAIPYAVSGAMFSDGKGNVSGFLNEDTALRAPAPPPPVRSAGPILWARLPSAQWEDSSRST